MSKNGRKGTPRFVVDPACNLFGAEVRIIMRSRETGAITVQLVEDKRPYKNGDRVVLAPYQVSEKKPNA